VTVNEAEPGQPGERLPLGYGRIRRGPMAADQFTQIRNALFRDPRLSLKDKGLFGLISTHRDGWGVTPESLATCCTDGVSAIKVALRNLEKYGYLRRARERRSDGTLGASSYYITDAPEAIEALEGQTPRSEPKVDSPPVANPPVDRPPEVEPPVAEPPVENRAHKNTNSKHTKSQNTLSPRQPHQTVQEPPAAQDEREIDPLVQKLMTDHGATEDEATTVVAQVRGEGRINSLASWASSNTGRLDIKQRLYAIRHSRNAPAAPGRSLPPWCGECGDGDPTAATDPARRFHNYDDGSSKRCDCHPASQKAA
jgi:hypothetical protein